MSDVTMDSLAGLLDESLDAIPDLPEYVTPPVGHYRLKVSVGAKDINDKPAVVFDYAVLDTLELADPAETPVPIGSRFSESFFMHNEMGKQVLKRSLASVISTFGCTTLLEAVQKVDGLEVGATVKHRKNKNDPTAPYAQVGNITVL